MNKIAIITSIDYELFGDGSGNVNREQILPTNTLLAIANQHDVKLTIMFEYAQYLAYEKYGVANEELFKDNEKIIQQLIEFIKDGHDVQLHYHAQWENIHYDKINNKFVLNLDTVDISLLKYERIVKILSDGKQFLENLLRPYADNYRCIGFRAGSWAVKNQGKLLKALIETGFKADSSVVPNVKFESDQVNFEYKNCPSQYHYWYINENLTDISKKKYFIEIPIFTKKSTFGFLKYLNLKYLQSRNIVNKLYKIKISEKNFSLFKKIKKIFLRNYYMADLNTMSAGTLEKMLEEVIFDAKFKSEDIVPIMFICHSKTSYFLDDLHVLYDNFENKYKEQIEYWTYQEAIEYLTEKRV